MPKLVLRVIQAGSTKGSGATLVSATSTVVRAGAVKDRVAMDLGSDHDEIHVAAFDFCYRIVTSTIPDVS